MYIISFHLIFNENANILAKRLNVEYVVNFNPQKNDLIIIFGAHNEADKLVMIQEQIGCKYIIIQTEQFESKVFDNKYYVHLLKNNYVLDWSKSNVERIKKNLDIKIYSFYFYDNFTTTNDNKTIDYFFCGAYSPEREKMLTKFKNQNPNYVIEYDFSNNHINPVTLNEKLAKVKYVINIPYYKNSSLETHRINKALSMGCQVISLYSSDLYLNEKYENVVHFVNDLSDFCPLLEQYPKLSYGDFMKQYGDSQILHNINSILYIDKLNKVIE
jgi:hypothetical protein